MARRQPGNRERMERQIVANRIRNIQNYDAEPMACTAKLEVEGEAGEKKAETCGCDVFDSKMCYKIGLVPEVVSGVPGGQPVRIGKVVFLICTRCGHVYGQAEWNALLRAQAADGEKMVILPDGDYEGDNGQDK